MRSYNFYVYIITSTSGTLYVGVTNNIEKRVVEHRQKLFPGFSAKYGCNCLVYFEYYPDIRLAIEREKQIKRWRRQKKEALIRSLNPGWLDLSREWRQTP